MIDNDFNSIIELIQRFPDQLSCVEYLEGKLWADGVISPFDEGSRVYRCKDVLGKKDKFINKRYRCKSTGKYFNVLTGTLFDNTKVPLQKWFLAIWLITSHKKGISSLQLHRDLRVTQKTAWFMAQRIRKCLDHTGDLLLENTVEIDEVYIGGKNKNRHRSKWTKKNTRHGLSEKAPVIGMLERGGKIIAMPVSDTGVCSLMEKVTSCVDIESTIYTDSHVGYRNLKHDYTHEVISHNKGQYVRGDCHTNGIEGFWGLLKRSIQGIYHWTSVKYLKGYVDEMVFRYNSRDISEGARFSLMLTDMQHRTKYKELTDAKAFNIN